MARTLDEIDAALAAAETRITQLTTAGQNINARLNAAENAIATAASRFTAIDNRFDTAELALRKAIKVARREIMQARAELLSSGIGQGKPEEARQRPNHPGRNPMIKKVFDSQGRVVARHRLAR